ncbi:cell wall metabolism sensor histidine kinase WalK [uncultured Pseudoflavonifractor sp.]|uniref:sensor histidine kinase n=1 Tax=uncultured Pseudoflavonifractor sp. TaxID=1221379 RepID=UPI0025E2EA20|nr:HAMP domain-containing sensor histidine kinase [uncultured Pseudoflavonifractor sp.]
MIDRLRKKFIRICMLSFVTVFFLLFAAIYLFTEVQTSARLDTLADLVSENDGIFPDFEQFGPEAGQILPPDGVNQESPFTTRFFTVRFDGDGELDSVDIRAIASVSGEEAQAYASAALEKGKERGWIGNFRYKVYAVSGGTAVVFINGADTRELNQRFLLTASSVFVAGSVVVLLLVILISRRAVKPAVESYQKQKQFVTDANHELKTPLTLIRTNLDIMESENGPNEWLSDIREETGIMTELVNRLVMLSRMDEDQSTLEMARFSLSEAVGETAAAFAGTIREKGMTLEQDVPPGVTCTGDEAAIRQLLSILMDNAVKYCDRGGVIRVGLSGGRRAVLTVDNTYEEVGSIQLDRLFDRFYRADRARTYGSGFGVGLSIAKAIVEKHRGEIGVFNLDGRTIRFRVKL